MNSLKKNLVIITVLTVALSGCTVNVSDEMVPEPFKNKPEVQPQPEPVATDSINRFTEKKDQDQNYENVRVWAEKYDKLKEQNDQLKKRNTELTEDNSRLMTRFEAMKNNLQTAEAELKDANEMLIEMRKELDGWKSDVLSFREEQNYIHKEQLKALIKILKLLGAEYTDEPEIADAAN